MTTSKTKSVYLAMAFLVGGVTACHKNEPEQAKPASPPPPPSRTAATEPLTDGAINAAVTRALQHDPGVNADEIHVATTDGVVELTGTTHHLLSKQRAVRVTEGVRGVKVVSDRTNLQIPKRPDEQIARDVNQALVTNAAADSYEVKEKVLDGKVTLTGNVQSFQERDLAGRLAEGVLGVRQVDNQIKVKIGVARNDAEVQADVISRLRWDTLVNDGMIDVAVHSGNVTLQGKVASAAEKRRAEVDAWVLGAGNVNANGLKVDPAIPGGDYLKHKLFARSASDIEQAIRAAAAYDPRVSAANLQVNVTDGKARLKGSVGSMAAKLAAEDLARHTVGITSVENDLEIAPLKPRQDAEVERAVRSALLWDPYTNSQSIQVKVQGGKVTLSGKTHSQFERAQATDLAAGIGGVKDVDNVIQVEHPEVAYVYDAYMAPYGPLWISWYALPALPTGSDAQIASAIHEEMVWDPLVDPEHVRVEVQKGHATLTGRVASEQERVAATEAAYERGAVAVDNRLTLSSGA